MSSSRPLVFLSDISWHALYQRPQHLAAGLAREGPVLWVEPATLGHPVSWTPIPVREQVYLLTVPLWPLNARNGAIRTLARLTSQITFSRTALEAIQARILRRALAKLGYGQTRADFVVQNFQLIGLADAVGSGTVLFDYIDDAFGFTPMPAYVHKLWERTIGRSDAITVTAGPLRDQIRSVRDVDVRLVPNGVEYERFSQPSPRPPDLPDDMPVAGYVGSVYPWFDFDLLHQAAEALPSCRFVVVGPEHPDVRHRTAQMRKHPRITFLGKRPYEQVPAYMQHFTAGIIPFVRNRLTESVNPVKLYEYCAAGIPTVTTLFSDTLLEFQKIVSVAVGRDAFITALDAGMKNPAHRDRLRAFARENDWEQRTRTIRSLLGSASLS